MELKARELEQLLREQEAYRALLERIECRRPYPAPKGLELTCIGNAGGADSTVRGYPTGGFLLRQSDRVVLVDPGENSLARLASLGFDAYQVTDVLASHSHNDHVGDLSSAVSAALGLGLTHRDCNLLVCPSLVDYAAPDSTKLGFTLPAFAWQAHVHLFYWRDVDTVRFDGQQLQSVDRVALGEQITVHAAPGRHSGVQVVGAIFELPGGTLGYTSDTEYFPELGDVYADCDVLWLNMSTLGLDSFSGGDEARQLEAQPVHNHLGYVGVCELIERVRPRCAIVSHLGSHLVAQSGEVEAMLRERFAETDVDVHCAQSGDRFVFEGRLADGPVSRRDEAPSKSS